MKKVVSLRERVDFLERNGESGKVLQKEVITAREYNELLINQIRTITNNNNALEAEIAKLKNKKDNKYDLVSIQEQIHLVSKDTSEKDNTIRELVKELGLYKTNLGEIEEGFNKVKSDLKEREKTIFLMKNEKNELIKNCLTLEKEINAISQEKENRGQKLKSFDEKINMFDTIYDDFERTRASEKHKHLVNEKRNYELEYRIKEFSQKEREYENEITIMRCKLDEYKCVNNKLIRELTTIKESAYDSTRTEFQSHFASPMRTSNRSNFCSPHSLNIIDNLKTMINNMENKMSTTQISLNKSYY